MRAPGLNRQWIGVIHLLPLPGAPAWKGGTSIVEAALRDARAFVEGGIDTLIVENFGDTPFFADSVPAETVAAMSLAIDAVQREPGVASVGVNVLRNDARSALGIAAATGADFVRINVHTGSMFTDQGWIQGQAASSLRLRASLCPAVRLLCDVHVKHAVPVPGEGLEDAARDAHLRGRADALIVSGAATGSAPDVARVERVRGAVGPSATILIGSGVDASNARELLEHADGAIVGTAVKRGGDVAAPVDADRVGALLRSVSHD